MLGILDELRHCSARFRRMQRQRMFRSHRAKRDAHDGIGARGEHKQLAVLNGAVLIIDRVNKRKPHADRFANPVFLHGANLRRPAGEFALHTVEQFVRVLGDG